MSDTGKTILWIVVAVVVIAVITWLYASAGRRREVEARRFEVGELRPGVDEHRISVEPVEDAEEGTSVTGAVADVERQPAEVTPSEPTARGPQTHRTTPDVEADDNSVPGQEPERPAAVAAGAAGSVAVGAAAFTQE